MTFQIYHSLFTYNKSQFHERFIKVDVNWLFCIWWQYDGGTEGDAQYSDLVYNKIQLLFQHCSGFPDECAQLVLISMVLVVLINSKKAKLAKRSSKISITSKEHQH